MPNRPEINQETKQLLQRIYRKNEDVKYEVKDGIVYIIKDQDHPIQRFARKLHVRIPETSTMELDQYGSFIFQQIDGEKTVEEIAHLLGEQFEEANTQLYDRLLVYLNHLEKNEKYISLVK